MGRVAACLISLHSSGRAHGSLSLACMLLADGNNLASLGCVMLPNAARHGSCVASSTQPKCTCRVCIADVGLPGNGPQTAPMFTAPELTGLQAGHSCTSAAGASC